MGALRRVIGQVTLVELRRIALRSTDCQPAALLLSYSPENFEESCRFRLLRQINYRTAQRVEFRHTQESFYFTHKSNWWRYRESHSDLRVANATFYY